MGLTVVAASSECTMMRIIGAMAEITARNPYRSMRKPCRTAREGKVR